MVIYIQLYIKCFKCNCNNSNCNLKNICPTKIFEDNKIYHKVWVKNIISNLKFIKNNNFYFCNTLYIYPYKPNKLNKKSKHKGIIHIHKKNVNNNNNIINICISIEKNNINEKCIIKYIDNKLILNNINYPNIVS
jgi:hypothetical protein